MHYFYSLTEKPLHVYLGPCLDIPFFSNKGFLWSAYVLGELRQMKLIQDEWSAFGMTIMLPHWSTLPHWQDLDTC